MVLSSPIDFLEVLSYCLVYVVSLTNELLVLVHGSHHGVSTLDLKDFLGRGVEYLHVSRVEVPLQCVQHLVVVEFSCELK